MFADRSDAGRRLAQALEEWAGRDALVLAIPRGGVEVGWQVARGLRAELSLVVVRKLPFPDNPEAGFGAVAEDGSTVLVEHPRLAPEVVRRILEQQQREIRRRIRTLRGGKPLPQLAGRLVVLVDDGLAMGSTMRAAVMLCRRRKAGRVVVAVPVAGPRAVSLLEEAADRVVAVERPPLFRAVAQAYRNWYDVSDREVLEILDRGSEALPGQIERGG